MPAATDLPGVATGFQITAGTDVQFSASGEGSYCGGCTTGPDGDPNHFDGGAVLPSAPVGTLLGEIVGPSQSSGWFVVGSSAKVTATQSGQLYLIYNDVPGSYYNNDGAYTVDVGGGGAFPPQGGQCVGRGARDAGRMVSNHDVEYDKWKISYGVSKCEGLVITGATLGSRLMAERMSTPYVNLQSCIGQSISQCGQQQYRHITLQPTLAYEPQSDGSYADVRLASVPPPHQVKSPGGGRCRGRSPCDHLELSATYRVYLTPPTGSGDQSRDYLDVTQRYSFYKEFEEGDFQDLACEPSQETFWLFRDAPLACARWKPMVIYRYHPAAASSPLLVSFNAGERLHFTPDSMALRSSEIGRDCEKPVLFGTSDTPQSGCKNPLNGIGAFPGLELYPPGRGGDLFAASSIEKETVVRGLCAVARTVGSGKKTAPCEAADSGSPRTTRGRYDQVHLTASHAVGLPFRPPGCEECVHMHWRWGRAVGGDQETFGNGEPLIGNRDDYPAGVTNTKSHQQLDVALVAYHSEELTPRDFLGLVQGASPGQLDMTDSTPTEYHGGYTIGSETLNYPSGACSDLGQLYSWGQCGQVLWLSGTTFTDTAHDEDQDTLFAFGGFFCSRCESNAEYAAGIRNVTPKYEYDGNAGHEFAVDIGARYSASPTHIYDVLPPGVTNVHVTRHTKATCDAPGRTSGGQTFVHCHFKGPARGYLFSCPDDVCVQIKGNAPGTPGRYRNVLRAIWGNASDDTGKRFGGNYRHFDDFVVH